MKTAMDIFGRALSDYRISKQNNLYFIEPDGSEEIHDLSRYFRSPEKLMTIEKKLLNLARGKILDVGCGTGNYFPAFKSNDVLGIDISEQVIKIAKAAGHNCLCQNILDFDSTEKFDTITFLENNLGMAESVAGLKKLLIKSSQLLNDDGQILAIMRRVNYEHLNVRLIPKYKGTVGTSFNWLFVGSRYLKKICKNLGLHAEIIAKDNKNNLVRITKVGPF